MDKCKQIKKRTWKLLIKNLIIFGVLVVITIVGVTSWFSNNQNVQAKQMSVKLKVPRKLEIAITAPGGTPSESNWVTSSEIDISSLSFVNSLNMGHVTGNGIGSTNFGGNAFINPYLVQDSDIAVVDSASGNDWETDKIKTTANIDYLSFDLHMRTNTSGCKVLLQDQSYCAPAVDNNGTLQTNFDDTFLTADNKITNNSLIGAVRVSTATFSAYTSSNPNTLNFVWIPAPHIWYHFDGLEAPWYSCTNTNSIKTGLLSANTYGLQKKVNGTLTNIYDSTYNGTYKHTFWKYTSSAETKVSHNNTDASKVVANTHASAPSSKEDYYKLGTDKDLVNLTYEYTVSNKTYYCNKIRFNCWVEGDDPESRAAQIAGLFNLSLGFELDDA